MGDNHDEEQALELEALEAIFVDDYEVLSDVPPRQVRLRLVPVAGDDSSEENLVEVRMVFKLPDTYPDVPPEMEVVPVKGLTSKQCEQLQQLAKDEAEANLGVPMMFTVAESIKDWLVENNRDHTDESMHAQMLAKTQAEEREVKLKEEAERRAREMESDEGTIRNDEDEKPRVIDGTIVTKENFLEWYSKFLEERRIANEESAPTRTLSGKGVAADAHLTGREYFEQRNLQVQEGGEVSALDEWDTEIQEDLFLEEDEDLDDLDDLDSDEEDDEE